MPMKKLIVLLSIAAAVGIAYRVHRDRQAPVDAFTAYADALARGRHDLARDLAIGELAGSEAGERHSAAGWVPVQELRGTSYTVTSRTASATGDEVTLDVTQTVGFNPPGVESALRPAMKATFRQRAIVRRTAAGWRVASFASELVAVDEISTPS
jgi:hypothetical protein